MENRNKKREREKEKRYVGFGSGGGGDDVRAGTIVSDAKASEETPHGSAHRLIKKSHH